MVLKHTFFRLEFADEDENGDIEPVAVAVARERLGNGDLSVKIIDLGVGYMVYAAIVG